MQAPVDRLALEAIAARTAVTVRSAVAALALASVALLPSPSPAAAQSLDQRVTQAALGTWVHGVTDEIAQREVGEEGVPVLIRLLADGTFPRRDNVVAFLGHLGGADATRALIRFIQSPPAALTLPQEDRAMLLAPQALGQIAYRRDPAAVDALLDMTEHRSNGGVLAAAAARAGNPAAMRDDLLEMALRGLGYSGDARARARLQAIAAGQIRPAAQGRNLRAAAATALNILNDLERGPRKPAPGAPMLDGVTGTRAQGAAGSVSFAADDVQSIADAVSDTTHTRVNDSRLTYANHPAVTSPMTDARLDQILAAASARMGKSDFAEDVACCAGAVRSGTQKTFGSLNDGLDVIDNSTEVSAVLNNSTARVKVVRVINYCGSPGTNIIGCGWVGGNGLALVRYSNSIGNEGVLWVHEFGHNVGLGHNSDSRYIMYGCLCGNNFGVTSGECNAYYSGGSSASLVDAGVCSDLDADQVQDAVDNCPGVSNYDQLDTDGDGVGDACEGGGCGNGVLDSGEECDGSALGGASCASEGFTGGTLGCTSSCVIDTASCTLCGDGVREGGEQCDGSDLGGASCSTQGCVTGTPSCSSDCTVSYASCGGCAVCDHDGQCETSEICTTCGSDCVSSGLCGNGVCEPSVGESCLTCPSDCAGVQSGKPSARFCCGSGAVGQNPVTCADPRCTQGTLECSSTPLSPSCCGDSQCGGLENSFNCALDCGAPPPCASTETSCTDGVDDDCDGFVDCADSNCASSSACATLCRPKDSSCTANSQCCSNRCKGSGVCG